ncbi:MAG TPA: hypothetical protein VKU00_11065 [Chthonomonadaceae bacterium]|nr:hypothetical protein [Chthonomonadaceae bacterium]
MDLKLQRQVETVQGNGVWRPQSSRKEVAPTQVALLLCDMWDKHWCQSATRRCDAIAHRLAQVVHQLRQAGVTILHAPSDCMEFYKEHPARQRMLQVPHVEPPAAKEIADPPLPIDDSDGGCDDQPQCHDYHAWTHQHPAISIHNEDGISDNGAEVYSLLQRRAIKTLLIAGVHTNMCVLHRTFAIKQMTRWGVDCVLIRDMTDTMYNPRMAPFVSHEEGTTRVISHIERYWCPTTSSQDLLAPAQPAVREIRREV